MKFNFPCQELVPLDSYTQFLQVQSNTKYFLAIHDTIVNSYAGMCTSPSMRNSKHMDEENGFGQEGIPLKRQDSL